jgi:hypothetical protein
VTTARDAASRAAVNKKFSFDSWLELSRPREEAFVKFAKFVQFAFNLVHCVRCHVSARKPDPIWVLQKS